jgi:hypothetical protein
MATHAGKILIQLAFRQRQDFLFPLSVRGMKLNAVACRPLMETPVFARRRQAKTTEATRAGR